MWVFGRVVWFLQSNTYGPGLVILFELHTADVAVDTEPGSWQTAQSRAVACTLVYP
jgi:hypothetical protein